MLLRRFCLTKRTAPVSLIILSLLSIIYSSSYVLTSLDWETLHTRLRLHLRRSVRFVEIFRLYNYYPRAAQVTYGNDSLARNRLLCWVLTNPLNVKSRLPLVRSTWSPRCDKTLFFSSRHDPLRRSWPLIGLNISGVESKRNNAIKAKRAWEYVYDHYRANYDWFMKTDDDTYLIVENLRQFLTTLNSSAPLFYGRQFVIRRMHLSPTSSEPLVFMSGGAGLLLSRRALDLLVEKGIRSRTSAYMLQNCMPHGPGEDWKVSRCLQWAGAKLGESRDANGRQRFNCFRPERHLDATRRLPDWFYRYERFGVRQGAECCSDYPITFHYMKREHFEQMEAFLYGRNTTL